MLCELAYNDSDNGWWWKLHALKTARARHLLHVSYLLSAPWENGHIYFPPTFQYWQSRVSSSCTRAYFPVDKRVGGSIPLVREFICKRLKRGNASLINGSSWFILCWELILTNDDQLFLFLFLSKNQFYRRDCMIYNSSIIATGNGCLVWLSQFNRNRRVPRG